MNQPIGKLAGSKYSGKLDKRIIISNNISKVTFGSVRRIIWYITSLTVVAVVAIVSPLYEPLSDVVAINKALKKEKNKMVQL